MKNTNEKIRVDEIMAVLALFAVMAAIIAINVVLYSIGVVVVVKWVFGL